MFIEAIADHDARMAHIYFDISGVAGLGHWETRKALIAMRIRQVGINRILWGSDGAFCGAITPEQALRAYQQLPLTTQEFHMIDTNVTPYMFLSGLSNPLLNDLRYVYIFAAGTTNYYGINASGAIVNNLASEPTSFLFVEMGLLGTAAAGALARWGRGATIDN